MKLTIYQIDAFSSHLFGGNPAAVCPLEEWLADELMQKIAAENNLSETAFFVPRDTGFEIRWFTPTVEVSLCGHATLAAAFVLFHELAYQGKEITFYSQSGVLNTYLDEGFIVLDFPSSLPIACATPQPIQQAFGQVVETCLSADDYIVVLGSEHDVLHAKPDLKLLKSLDLRGVIVTAKSNEYDFVSRFFAPNCGIDEDPVTGSSFTQLAPYWAQRLGKIRLSARQISQRGGEVNCELTADRVKISGKAVKYLEGVIYL